MEPRIQYAKTADGVSIAYWTLGEGDLPLVISPPLGWSHISRELRIPQVSAWYEHLALRRMLVRYDPRNQGLSDREVERFSEADLASDVEAVIERLGSPKVDLLGCYGPGTPVLRVAAEHPETVRKLIVWNLNVKGPTAFASEQMKAMRSLIDSDWELFTNIFAATRLGWTGELAAEWAHFMRRAVTAHDAALILDGLGEIDWSPWLAKIRVPTLVLRGWGGATLTEGRWSDIADVRLVDLDKRDQDKANEGARAAIDEFLGEGEKAARELPAGTAVILFADIVDSTALTERLGDTAFRAKARKLDTELRTVIKETGGTPVEGKLVGDGLMAVFTSAHEAIEAARRGGRAGESAGLPLHLGIHAGDVIREGNNVYGGAVNITARIAGASASSEVLVSDTVRGLARTSAGVVFDDRGERELKGVAEPQRLFAVRAQSAGS